MIYLDGSALCRFLPGVRHYEAFGEWARDHGDELVTTQLGLTELRQAAELYPRSAAERVLGIVETVRTGVAVIRFSDDNVTISSHATAVLKPFAALHVGAAVSHDKVDTIATYDPALASVARIYDLAVVSPGLPQDWYAEYEGPSEHWRPVALDAPYAPGAEFDAPEMAPKADAYEDALREAEAEETVATARHDGDDAVDELRDEVPDDGPSELEQALREAEDAARAAGDAPAEERDADQETPGEAVEGGGSGPDAEAAGGGERRLGTYRPRIEAWHAGDDDVVDSMTEAGDESNEPEVDPEPSGEGSGLPWAQGAVPEASAGPVVRSHAPPPLLRTEEHTIGSEGSPPQAPPVLAPPAAVEAAAVPNLPREERGVPPVAPASRPSAGSPARRPMFETEPHPESRASRPPDPVPPTPPEESKPLTVPIKWNVELDEPEAYLPVRHESSGVRPLPSFPVSFAGGQGGLTLESPSAVSVPALEPSGGARSVFPVDGDARSQEEWGASSGPRSARDRKAAEKAAKRERERNAKLAKKSKGAAALNAAPQPRASVPPATPAASGQTASSPTGTSDAWKLDDVLSLGKQKKKDA